MALHNRAISRWLRTIVTALTLATVADAEAAEIKVLASNAVKEGYRELIPEFEAATHHKVAVEWGGTVDIVARVRLGEAVDVVIIPASGIDSLIAEGLLAPRSRVDLVKSKIGAAVRPGLPKPSVASVDELKTTLLAAKSVVLSSGPSSGFLERLYQQMGIGLEIKRKTHKLKPGASVAEALARGEGDLGFTQVSELVTNPEIEYLGELPNGAQSITTFSAGVSQQAAEPRVVDELLRFLNSPHAAAGLRRLGLEPD